jgi:hypothetical protein
MSSPDELRRIAEELLLIAERDSGTLEEVVPAPQRRSHYDPEIVADPDHLLDIAKALYRTRQIRARYFPSDLFGEPAWDILLDLFIEKGGGKRVPITNACIASQVPPTTGLRWIGLLLDDGWIVREEDTTDRRRAFVRLTEKGETAIARCLADTANSVRPISQYASVFKSWTS